VQITLALASDHRAERHVIDAALERILKVVAVSCGNLPANAVEWECDESHNFSTPDLGGVAGELR
jgi:hypothetical protein